VGESVEHQCNVVRVAALVNFAVRDGNERETDGQEVQSEDGGGQNLLQVVLGSQLSGSSAGWASSGLLWLGLVLKER